MKKLLNKISSKEKTSPSVEKKNEEPKSDEKPSADDWGVDLKLFKGKDGKSGVTKDDFELLNVIGKGSFAKVKY